MTRLWMAVVLCLGMSACSAESGNPTTFEEDSTDVADAADTEVVPTDAAADITGYCMPLECEMGVCDATALVPEGESCGTGPCDTPMICQGGECLAQGAICDDEDPCTDDACDIAKGCTHTPRTGGEITCGEGECATINVQCIAGALQTCTPKEPGQETCDSKDNDCDGEVDNGIPEQSCGVGACMVTAPGCVEGLVPTCEPNPGRSAAETCNGKDDDCDGVIDNPGTPGCQPYLLDNDQDGFAASATDYQCLCAPKAPYTALTEGDCNDNDGEVNKEAPEKCNGKDDNCDGTTDEAGTSDCVPFYTDADGDTYGDSTLSNCQCIPSDTHQVQDGTDCDDTKAAVNPGAVEACNTVDDNCDSIIDAEDSEGCVKYFLDEDVDGYGVASETDYHCICAGQPKVPKYTAQSTGDCCDKDNRVRPYHSTPYKTISFCQTWDFNCDGVVKKEYPDSGVCDMELVTCNVAQYGFVNGWVECGEMGNYLIDCSYNWGVCDKTTETRTQGCY